MEREKDGGTVRRKKSSAMTIGAAAAAIVLAFSPGESLAKPPGGTAGVSHAAKQSPPIELGTSGGWSYDLANGYCCGGTLGALVDIGGTQYILSNWHVLAMDTAAGGNNRVAGDGDPVIQPGLIDVRCNAGSAQAVGTLAMTPSPLESNVDAAIAEVVPGMVAASGAILEIGPLAAETADATLGQAVKKSGRTTRLTRSKVSALNATVNVSYETECAGSAAFVKKYTGQIIVANKGSKFLNSGDSGSLLVEDVASSPRAVGLLFAGSNLAAVANPIGEVLATLDTHGLSAAMVGTQTAAAPAAATADLEVAIERALAAQTRNADVLERVPESTGHAIGLDAKGRVVIKVLVESDSPRARAGTPRSLDGVPVEVVVVGRIVAY